MSGPAFEQYRAIDTDTHVTEPADVWTSRVPAKWKDAVPTMTRMNDIDLWTINGQPVGGPGYTTAAGFDGSYPEHRKTFHDCPPASYDANARLAHMDAEGIHASVLYPNVGGFGSGAFLKLGDPQLMLACVRAYNDFLVEWASAEPNRLVPVAAMPFWDVEACVAEIERATKIGHRSILACSEPQAFGQPRLSNPHWDPFWAACRDAGQAVSFHIGAGDLSDLLTDESGLGIRANFARTSSTVFMQNMNCIADLIFGGVCHRFPELQMVSVESGVGWIPSFLEAADWQWSNAQVTRDHPEWDLLPSEYFARQIYACFWFEEKSLGPALEKYADNILWETDYPHPTCQHPGPANGLSQHPRDYIEGAFADVPPETLRKVLHDNAARLYRVE